jgi:homopolymeric O-antigen transport system permease protein
MNLLGTREATPRVLMPGGWERGTRAAAARVARAWNVLVALAESDMRARYGRGRWQLIKWLADPFAVTGIYLLLITFVLDRGGPAPGLSLACAILPFQLVMMSVVNALSAVSSRRAILLNMAFDRKLLPISSVMTESVAAAASLGLIVLMMAVYGVAPTVAIVWLPLVIAVTVIVAVGFAYLAALVGVWFADLRVFAVSLIRTLYFVAPGLIPLSEIYGRAHDLLKLNPLTGLFEAFRDVLLYGQRPAAWELLIPLGIALLLLAIFVPIYRSEQRHFVKVVE